MEDYSMIQKQFGRGIKKLREKRAISQEKFSLLIGMDRTYYASVEAGKRNISLQNIKKISDGFEMTLAQLFEAVEKVEE